MAVVTKTSAMTKMSAGVPEGRRRGEPPIRMEQRRCGRVRS